MSNLLSVLPDFDVRPFTHLLPSLEKALVATPDLLSLDPLDLAKRAQLPPGEVKKLGDAISDALHASLHILHDPAHPSHTPPREEGAHSIPPPPSCDPISTLDDRLDRVLGGGIPRGCLTEVVGESAAGKTQFLLTLLLSVQLSADRANSALYISTEAPLQTTRLTQILDHHPRLLALPADRRPSLARIHSTHLHDVEAQEHILRYQVPVAIRKQNVGLLIVDSVAANYRAEFDKSRARAGAASFAHRSAQVAQLGALLRHLARAHRIAVVVANQVADRFTLDLPPPHAFPSQSTQRSRPASPPQSLPPGRSGTYSQPVPSSDHHDTLPATGLSTDDPLALDHQQRFFTGWGDDPAAANPKTPSLGLTWTNQLAARIALLKAPVYDEKTPPVGEERSVVGWKRTVKVVFAAWCAEAAAGFEIGEGGVRGVEAEAEAEEG